MNFIKHFSPPFWYTIILGTGLSVASWFGVAMLAKAILADAAGIHPSQTIIHSLTVFLASLQPQSISVARDHWLMDVILVLYWLACIIWFRIGYLVGRAVHSRS